jgi:hypothetical protein
MTFNEIKYQISNLAQKHASIEEDSINDFSDAEWLEEEAEDLIVTYCEENGYLINGFPSEKRKFAEEELDDDYFCRERFQLYLDMLTTEKNDVADLMWHYNSSFWPSYYLSKDEYLEFVKANICLYNLRI